MNTHVAAIDHAKHGIQVTVSHRQTWTSERHVLSAGRTRGMIRWAISRLREQGIRQDLVGSDVRTYQYQTQITLLYK